ncbi:MAG: hypothetical protein ACSHW0_09655 [Thalassotalea sp.]
MKTFIHTFAFISILFSLSTFADELKIITDVSRASGEVRVYLQNIASKNIVVLTKNLTVGQSGDQLTLSPDKHALVMDKKMYTLKEDLSYYGAVTLKPGEITYIRRPSIRLQTGELIYKIDKKWAKLHDIWAGTARTNF